MSQKETIEKYIDAFLKGRSQSAVDKFKAKAEKLQYASIMQWRRRMRKLENTPKGTKEILDTLHRAQTLIENAPITDSDLHAIQAELTVDSQTILTHTRPPDKSDGMAQMPSHRFYNYIYMYVSGL